MQSQIANENDSSPEAHQQTNNKDLYQDETVDANYDNANDPKTEYENWNLLQTQLADEEMLGQQYILTKGMRCVFQIYRFGGFAKARLLIHCKHTVASASGSWLFGAV